jgi:hypothetical protein
MRSSQFRGITLHLQRDTPCTGAPPGQAPMLFETYTICRPNEKIFRCRLAVLILQGTLTPLVQKPINARINQGLILTVSNLTF